MKGKNVGRKTEKWKRETKKRLKILKTGWHAWMEKEKKKIDDTYYQE